jgi:phosphate starvation-inducible PhoH-like protein
MEPWMRPIIHNIEVIIGEKETSVLQNLNLVKIEPVTYMRGRTFLNSAIIVDEAQNVTHEQMEMCIGRLGKGSKMIICGDLRQKDLDKRSHSGLPFLMNKTKDIEEVGHIGLKENHRDPLVEKLLEIYQDYKV